MRRYRGLLLLLSVALLITAFPAAANDLPAASPVEIPRLGPISFPVSCSDAAQRAFPHAVALLHAAAFDQAMVEFTAIARQDPKCAMAYWGEAMAWWRPLWQRPGREALANGLAAIEKAAALDLSTGHEQGYVRALHAFYADYDRVDERTRIMNYRNAMARLHRYFPKDHEVSVFYAVALLASASAAGNSADRREAAGLLEKIFTEEPDHPGAAHYLIHCFDHDGAAKQGLLAAESYARIAPPLAHDLHLPSHIFTRLGLWQESIDSNIAAERAAADAARARHLPFASAEQLHAMDFLMYAYLQEGRASEAQRLLNAFDNLHTVEPTESAYYAMAAIPARFAVEGDHWTAAAVLTPYRSASPEARAITHWARALGAAHLGKLQEAGAEVSKLESLRDFLAHHPQAYDWSAQVEILRREAAAWLAHAQSKNEEALSIMQSAVDLENSTPENAVSPGPVLPAVDLLADLLMDLHRPREAFQEYRASLAKAPHRFHAIRGAERAASAAADQAASIAPLQPRSGVISQPLPAHLLLSPPQPRSGVMR